MSWLNFNTNILLKIDHLTLENNNENPNAEVIIETQQMETHQNLSGKNIDLVSSLYTPKMDWGTGPLAFDICCLCPIPVCFEFSFMERNKSIQSTVLYKSLLQPEETGWDGACTHFRITDYLVGVILLVIQWNGSSYYSELLNVMHWCYNFLFCVGRYWDGCYRSLL